MKGICDELTVKLGQPFSVIALLMPSKSQYLALYRIETPSHEALNISQSIATMLEEKGYSGTIGARLTTLNEISRNLIDAKDSILDISQKYLGHYKQSLTTS